jgi:hypothetical protein
MSEDLLNTAKEYYKESKSLIEQERVITQLQNECSRTKTNLTNFEDKLKDRIG